MFWNKPLTGLPRLYGLGLLGMVAGIVAAALGNWLPLLPREEMTTAAYRTPKFPGGTPLSMAMVHDVIHERYLHHGAAWYEKRNEMMRGPADEMQPNGDPSDKNLSAMDDLAVGLDYLHQDDQAAAIMRDKLRLMGRPEIPVEKFKWDPDAPDRSSPMNPRDEYLLLLEFKPLDSRSQQEYTAEANLGTVLIHGSFAAAAAGDADARRRLQEGLAHIERSVEINPLAHFGRENWQAIVVRHFLASQDHPELLTTYTVVGDVIESTGRSHGPSSMDARARQRWINTPDSELPPDARARIREAIGLDAIDPQWAAIVKPAYSEPVPFDEPALGLLGMWTLGGGPNPHFALALGRIMESAGQRAIAWCAYERAIEMGDRFSPAAATRQALIDACRRRQIVIAMAESPGDVKGWEDSMRRKHVAELAWGQAYQHAYQSYEEEQISKGVGLYDAHFYDAFFKDRPSIASSPGAADQILVMHIKPQSLLDLLPLAALGAAGAMLLGSFIRQKPQRNPG